MQVSELMTQKTPSVTPETTVEALARLLLDHNLSGVPVVNGEGELVGVVSEGDLLHKECTPRLPNFINLLGAVIFYNGVDRYDEDFKKLMARQVSDIMTDDAITVLENTDVEEAASLMIENQIRQLPVVDLQNHLLGMVRRSDIIKLLLQKE